jgi:AcrR family transcriptional regulator
MPKIVRKSEKKRFIALSAIDLIAENGLSKTSVDLIAQAANVGKGTVYLYFKKKEEIIIEIWDYVCEILNRNREIKFKTVNEVSQKIDIFFDFSVLEEKGLLDKLLKIYATNMSIVLTALHTPLKENFNKKTREDIQSLKDLLDEGVRKNQIQECDTQVLANLFENIFKGTLINGICKNRDISELRTKMHAQRDLLLSLLKKKG